MQLVSKQIYENVTVIQVAENFTQYQDKFCREVVLTLNNSTLKAIEITPTKESVLKNFLYKEVKIVCLNAGGGSKLPWIKMDQPMNGAPPSQNGSTLVGQPVTEERDKLFLARDSAKIAADIIVTGRLTYDSEVAFTAALEELTLAVAKTIQNVAKKL
jgi:hypothetical protein